MIRVIFLTLLIWFLYNFIFKFVVPVYRTTREMKDKFREMNSRMQDPAGQQQDYSKTSSAPTEASPKVSKEDYIDFEEIK